MKLMTKEFGKKIPNIMETEVLETDEIVVWVHYYLNNRHWYLIEYDRLDTFFGYAVYVAGEFGHYYLSELVREGFKRDLRWNYCKLSLVMERSDKKWMKLFGQR